MLFYSEISEPFIPETSIKVKNCLGKLNNKLQWPSFKKDFNSIFERVETGEEFKPIENLFKKIDDSQALDLEKRFEGSED